MSARIDWGTGFARFRLVCDSPEPLHRARDVLGPWLGCAQGRSIGVWSVQKRRDGWELSSPEVLRPYLEAWSVGDRFPSVDHLIKAVEFQATATAVIDPNSPTGLHGALLAHNGRAIAVVGEKEAGKSTLAVTLWQAGLGLLSDDGLFFEPDGVRVRPVPRRVRLRAGSQALFAKPLWRQLQGLPSSFQDDEGGLLFCPHPEPPESLPLTAIIILSAAPGNLQPLSEADALLDVVRHTHRHHIDGVRATLHRLAPLMNRIPCYRLGRGRLSDSVAQIERIL